MNNDKELWNKYCSYYEKDFSVQVEQNEKELKSYLKKWSHTIAAKKLCPKGVRKLEDVPITENNDYFILRKFGDSIENKIKQSPKAKGESWWDYYKRIEKEPKKILNGWLPAEYGACFKTSGTSGESKWFVQSKDLMEIQRKEMIAAVAFACSDEWGKTSIKSGDIILNPGAPIPYGSGFAFKMLSTEFKLFPSIETMDDMSDMKAKIKLILKGLKNGQIVHVIAAMAAQLNMICQALVSPELLYKDLYDSSGPGMKKIILYIMYIMAKRSKKEIKHVKDMLPIKGLLTAGFDSKLYAGLIEEQFGTGPLITYASSEYGITMIGMPDRKMDLMTCLRIGYFEFLNEKGEIKKINELKKDRIYEIIGTPFGSMIARYKIGDILRVIDFRDDGMPIFNFESRKINQIDIKNYFKISENQAFKIMEEAGLRNSDRWAITKEFEPDEHLYILMEKDWVHNEIEASKLIYNIMLNKYEFFKNYIDDFAIRGPQDIIKVHYLKKGAFMRYSKKKMKSGVEFGQYKSPKLITPEKKEIVDLLCEV